MKKKIIAAVIAALCIISAVFYTVSHKSKNTNTIQNNKTKMEFKILSAFSDTDLDMVIQDKDPKDDDTSGDYIFIKFTAEVADNKKNDSSNPVDVKSYTFDNKSLPEGTKIYVKDKYQIVIKLKDGYLNGTNSPHDLVISKNLVDKVGNKLEGSLNLKLPYSNSSAGVSNESSKETNSTSAQNNDKAGNTGNSPANNAKDKGTAPGENKSSSSSTGSSPKYTVELGKGLPYATVVMVKLDTPNPENYKVSIEGTQLELKTNSDGKKVFIKGIKKVYELDQVQKLVKIEKIK